MAWPVLPHGFLGTSAATGDDDTYQIARSLRFNDNDSAHLSGKLDTATDGKKLTISLWYKRGNLGGSLTSYGGCVFTKDASNFISIAENLASGGDEILLWYGGAKTLSSTPKFRDPAAWYHLVFAFDSTQATAANRCKVYINGAEITSWATDARTNITQNSTLNLNSSGTNYLISGYNTGAGYGWYDGYLAECNVIDGQTLTPNSFAETDAITGRWKAKAYTGTYGANGFCLNFSDNTGTTAITLGRDNKLLSGYTSALPILATDSYGVATTTGTNSDSNASSLVLALSMDGSNGGTTFTDRSPSGRTSSTKTATANGNAQTSTTKYQFYGSSGSFDGTGDYLSIPASSDFDFGTGDFTIEWWQNWSSISGFQTIYSNNYVTLPNLSIQTGNGTGLHRVFLNSGSATITETSAAPTTDKWYHYALVRAGTTVTFYRNGIAAGSATSSATAGNSSAVVEIGGVPTGGGYYINGYLQDFRVYKGAAKYTAAFTPPSRNNWTPNNFSVTAGVGNDSLVDSPTNYGTDIGLGGEVRGSYCTLNPLDVNNSPTFSNGNLDLTGSGAAAYHVGRATLATTSGKWYWEATVNSAISATYYPSPGIVKADQDIRSVSFYQLGGDANGFCYMANGQKYSSATLSAYGASFTQNDVVGFALDMDAGTLVCYKNGVSQGTLVSGLTGSWSPSWNVYGSTSLIYNFGQRPFAYTAPSGFKALCTTNLPTPTIQKPSSYFDASLYTGNGSTQNITGLGFSPEFVWIKSRGTTGQHVLTDAVRGTSKQLFSSSTAIEGTQTDQITSFNSDGFSLGANLAGTGSVNQNTTTYVAWSWDVASSNSTNNSGTISSTVRANTIAGVSVVTYTGNNTANATVGHGLATAPKMILVKQRDGSTYAWNSWHTSIGSGYYIQLNTTAAIDNSVSIFPSGGVTSTTFNVGGAGSTAYNNASGGLYVAYCFSEVEGFSKFGSYTGNNSTDGPFVWCGFRPRWVLLRSLATGQWSVYDTARNTGNVIDGELRLNTNEAENGFSFIGDLDILSNGFKVRSDNNGGWFNPASATNVLFAAFAESPFKYARAR